MRNVEASGKDECTAMHHLHVVQVLSLSAFFLVVQMEASLFIAVVNDRKNSAYIEYSSRKSPQVFLVNSKSVYKTHRQHET
jgi:hypothetical protein